MIVCFGCCEVIFTRDDWEKGLLEEECSLSVDVSGVYKDCDELLDAVIKKTGLQVPSLMWFDNMLTASFMVDECWNEPTQMEYERWRNGEEKLFLAEAYIHVKHITGEMTDFTEETARHYGIAIA